MEKLEMQLIGLDGSIYRLYDPLELSCVKSNDTPADSLKAVFFGVGLPENFPEIREATVRIGEKLIFEGICDRQERSWGEDGTRFTLCARSLGGRLLDNEAIPQVYSRAAVGEIFRRHIAPYGFVNATSSNAELAIYSVGKGVSEWDAFAEFCRRAAGRPPLVIGNRVVFAPDCRTNHALDKESTEVRRLKREIRREGVISQVAMRDKEGRYSTIIKNSMAEKLGIIRRRCLIPQPMWARAEQDAGLRMERSMLRRICWEVELSGILCWDLGDGVSLLGFAERELRIAEIEYRYAAGQGTTKLVLD